jgi:hypothetical protein
LIARPTSCAHQARRTATAPVASSTSTSTQCAPKVYAPRLAKASWLTAARFGSNPGPSKTNPCEAAIGPPAWNSDRMAISLKVTASGTPFTPTAPLGRSSRSAFAHSISSAACSKSLSRIETVATATARPVM